MRSASQIIDIKEKPAVFYRRMGSIPPKRHTHHRRADGTPYFEELIGEEGFSSDSSLLYHRGIPSAIVDAVTWQLPDQTTTPNHPLTPRHLRLHDLFPPDVVAATDMVTGRRLLLSNNDVQISYVVAAAGSPLYRNGIGDEVVYIESGTARMETVFGSLQVRSGDYVLVPRSTTHRWLPDQGEPLRAFTIEAAGHIAPPARYLSRFGQFLESSPYCERDIDGPEELCSVDGTDVDVFVKHRGPSGLVGTRYTYAEHPFDVVGWDGCLYPYVFNITNFEPITGRVHQPPPVHQLFEGPNFVICNFVPRNADYHPLAIPLPYYHSNVDSDEVLFYVDGDYAARQGSGIAPGSLSLHPGGHAHGPQRDAFEASAGTTYLEETAVMIDTFHPLQLGQAALVCADPDYAWSWAGRALQP
ncbi:MULTISPECIES: homogentisate 1,2-dioxygenase [unclassified Mycolicibacterium]|uniref:homogentisate 1,2-dioxygenase n=1 Tax=unclassified Mycolicibacterium TaxID=2636767 RepID=UPI002ED893EE